MTISRAPERRALSGHVGARFFPVSRRFGIAEPAIVSTAQAAVSLTGIPLPPSDRAPFVVSFGRVFSVSLGLSGLFFRAPENGGESGSSPKVECGVCHASSFVVVH